MTAFELTRKYEDNVYVDMCNKCFTLSNYKYPVKERDDLRGVNDFDSDLELFE
jgi:hypothetical protein